MPLIFFYIQKQQVLGENQFFFFLTKRISITYTSPHPPAENTHPTSFHTEMFPL